MGAERENQRGGREGKTKRETQRDQAPHAQNIMAQENEIKSRSGESILIQMERCHADICTRFAVEYTETLLGHHGYVGAACVPFSQRHE